MTTASYNCAAQDDTDPAAIDFVFRNLRAWGLDVTFQDGMRAPYGADRATGKILLPTGLPWRTTHARIDRAWLFMLGGSQWAREFQPEPLSAVPLAKVIPILRKPW